MKPQSQSLEDIYKEKQEADKLTGVLAPENRYAKSDELYKQLKETMMKQRGPGLMADIQESLGEGAAAGPYWWQSAAGYGKAGAKLQKSRMESENKQDEAFAALERAKEKEVDAIRRGDSAAIQKTKEERRKAEFDLNKAKADVQYHRESIENKGDIAQEKLDLEKEKALMKTPDYQNLIMRQTNLENRLRKDPNDQKAKEELAKIREDIARKRAEAGIAVRGSVAPAAPSGKLVQNKDGSYSYQR